MPLAQLLKLLNIDFNIMYYGFNGENWFDAADDASNQWVIDATRNDTPFTLRFRIDKPDSNPADVDALIALSQKFKDNGKQLKIVYCINVKDENKQLQVDRLKTAINGGVDVVAVEFGNETYSGEQADFDFNIYKGWFEPLKVLIEAEYPSMPLLVFLAPRPKESGVLGGRNDHSTFNNAAIDYINANSNCFPTVHIYLNINECPTHATTLAKRKVTLGVLDTELDTHYMNIYNEALGNYTLLWNSTLNYINTRTNKPVYITEWGFDNYGNIKNTLATAAIAFYIWTNYYKDTRIAALMQHNGLSKSLPGMISPANKDFDIAEPNSVNIRRLDYWVFKLFMDNLPNITTIFDISVAGKYAIPITFNSVTTPFSLDTLEITSSSITILGGKFNYSSSGNTAWMAKGSTRSYEVAPTVIDVTQPFILPANYFGFYTVTVDIVLPINTAPVSDAGDDFIVYTGETFILDGKDSYDVDGTITEYVWYDEAGKILYSGPSSSISLVLNTEGEYVYYLEVRDDKGFLSVDSIKITATNKPCTKPWWCVFVPRHRRCNC